LTAHSSNTNEISPSGPRLVLEVAAHGRREHHATDRPQRERRQLAQPAVEDVLGDTDRVLRRTAMGPHRAVQRRDPAVDRHHRLEDVAPPPDVGHQGQHPLVLGARLRDHRLGEDLSPLLQQRGTGTAKKGLECAVGLRHAGSGVTIR
jgi:hypothetical protein